MEAEKSYDLLSAGWGPRKVGGIVPVEIERPENQESQWCKSHGEATNFSLA